MVMAARFQVLLTQVRRCDVGQPDRDERTRPEVVCDAFVTETAEQAQAMFRSLRALRSVRLGKQRAKIIALAGLDIDHPPTWVGRPVAAVPMWLDAAGAR